MGYNKPNFDKRQCQQCGTKYKPRTSLDKYCDGCKEIRKAERERSNPWHGIDIEQKRGEAVKCTPLASDIERSVAKRVARMK